MTELAKVLPFRLQDKRCGTCINVALHPAGLYCREWQAAVLTEREAEDCPAYEHHDWGL